MIYEATGVAGVVLVLGAYFLLIAARLHETDAVYLGLNILGSALILVSLGHRFNLAATVLQAAWIAITLGGALWRRGRRGSAN